MRNARLHIDEDKLRMRYVCRPCFRELEKNQKLQKQLALSQEKLADNVQKALSYLPLTPVAAVTDPSVQTRTEDHVQKQKHAVRQGSELPVVASVGTESPPVSVRWSIIIMLLEYLYSL